MRNLSYSLLPANAPISQNEETPSFNLFGSRYECHEYMSSAVPGLEQGGWAGMNDSRSCTFVVCASLQQSSAHLEGIPNPDKPDRWRPASWVDEERYHLHFDSFQSRISHIQS